MMIEVKKLSKDYQNEKIIKNISLKIKSGVVFGFLGPNGAGKTTTIKMLVGLSMPDRGSIKINGKSPNNIKTREKIGFMPEDPYFYDHLTGVEFLTFCGQLFLNSRSRNKGYYTQIISSVGLFEARNKMLKTYSKGMKQRLGLAQAIVNDPDYIFLDEPLDGLDPIGRREIKQIILDLKKRKKTIFFNSHILSDVEQICDQIGIIDQGKLLYSGSVKQFCKRRSLESAFVDSIEENAHRNGSQNAHRKKYTMA